MLHDFVRAGAQFVIATHSPIILAYPGATLYEFAADGMRRVRYEDTDHYLVTRGFLSSTERSLRELLREDDDDPRDESAD